MNISSDHSFHNNQAEDEILGDEKSSYFSYIAYGLGIHSALPIPLFVPAEVKCDVTVTLDTESSLFDYVPQEVIEQPFALQVEQEEAIVYVKEAGVFLVREGCKVVVIPALNGDESKLQLALVGTVMAILLQQRGALVLHASAVEINSKAVLFLGNSGEGKSSMAAALQAQGYTVIADDVAAVNWEEGRAVLAPGFPQIKLSQEVAESLGYDWELLWQLHPRLEKRGLRVAQNFPQNSLPIERIYVLASASEVKCKPMKAQAGLMALMQHSELMNLIDFQEVNNFERCASLVQSCQLVCLQRPRNLALLPELVQVVEKEVSCADR
ncbi:MAG: hypothetical protein KA714_30420 [Limnoraphis sp. WC205]|jgi:hypothetical protein|nr:hypothetical protein [Limnoraphis sp. WC205]